MWDGGVGDEFVCPLSGGLWQIDQDASGLFVREPTVEERFRAVRDPAICDEIVSALMRKAGLS